MRITNLVSVSSLVLIGLVGCQSDPSDGDGDTEGSAGGPAEPAGEAGSDSGPGRDDGDPSSGEGGGGNADEGGKPSGDGGSDDGGEVLPGDPEPEPDPEPVPGEDSGMGGGSDPGPAARFFMPSGEGRNTNAPTLETDKKGGTHAVYPAYVGGGAFYAYCGPGCSGPGDVKSVAFETDGTVVNAMLALDAQGRPRVLLATYLRAYYASCDSGCDDGDNWQINAVFDHDGDKEITGEAFALDPSGHPRFLMHTYRIPIGLGQKAPETHVVSCESDCLEPGNWTSTRIAQQIWENSELKFDADGRAHVATVAHATEGELAGQKLSAYVRCDSDCVSGGEWNGTGLVRAFQDPTAAASIQTATSLALTRSGAPRVVTLGINDTGGRAVYYFECDSNCTDASGWQATTITDNAQIGAGLDLALDAKDHPRFVYTIGYNIGLYSCEETSCIPLEAEWTLSKVEFASDLPEDPIILYPNCTVSAWFLHDASLAVTPDGSVRVAYQASDVSGGWDKPNPAKPDCEAGADMTLTRMALMQ